MLRVAFIVVVYPTLALVAACSDLNSNGHCAPGQTELDGACWPDGDAGSLYANPPPQTRQISLACTNNITPEIFPAGWRLTVDPGPIVAGEAFGVKLRGVMVIDEDLLDTALMGEVGAYKRSNVLELHATVHVRSGVETDGGNPRDVVLTNEAITPTCTYDNSGNIGPRAGPFPPCQKDNDHEDGLSNDDCTGVNGVPTPENRCGEFSVTPTSDDCDVGGLCEEKGKGVQCELYEFCVSDSLDIVLEGEVESYIAKGSGNVLFGWADDSTGAEFVPTGGADEGIWVLAPAVYTEGTGPNGFRILISTSLGSLPGAFECTMGLDTDPVTRSPDSELISFPIQTQ